ncbi:TonB-dependent hemoglobin/transferrin/lactoferrin family receptor [Shewanella surugensis]|uniref:TonB-dependent hemoglobin/transferrin/lactoferrin family receptor n=1 Tax=Shewanella surugensis TaxID=212020 RepID=A0ABT0LA67_9GAMM|nr:TonB-dependent hemoglobin/transferrin/lactoferrin family receptor [Shewanella surugensis]MCL1124535.1 TonB-dependent hemoglobin/transferrin/lactoferrin family receptor [Shewanella surugensis]
MFTKPLAIFMAVSQTTLAFADGSQPYTEFDEVLVSATRINEKASDTSQSIAVVNEEQLQELQPNSVAGALKNEANISSTNGPRSSSQGVEIRGLSGQQVLQVIDGVRQNANSGHRGTYFMDPELLQSIEVIRGPASSVWGSGAIGGVVAQNTKSAKDLLEGDAGLGGYIKQGYETNGDRTTTSGAMYGKSESVDWLINGSTFDNNDIQTGDGDSIENSASDGNSGLIKLGWEPSIGERLQLSTRLSQIDELVPSNPSTDVSSSVPLVRRNTTDKNVTLSYDVNPNDNPLLNLHTLFYWNSTRYDEDRVTQYQRDNTDYNTVGLSINNESKLGTWSLLYGVDAYRDTFTTVRDDNGQEGERPDNIDADATVMGAFTQANVDLTQSIKLTTALRYDHYQNDSNSLGLSSADSALSPTVGLMWNVSSWLSLSARYDQAFRAPSMEEMYSTGTHYCIPAITDFLPDGLCNTFEINPDLKSETAKNKEVQADLRFEHLLGNDELALTLNVFRNDVDDYIEQSVSNAYMGISGLEQTTSWNNVAEARLTGFELSGRYRYEQTRFIVNYGQTEGKDTSTNEYLSDVPANKVTADLSQGIMQGDVKLGTRFTHVNAQDQLPEDNTQVYDSYSLWDLYVSWEPSIGHLEGFRFDVSVDNIGDEQYRQAWQTLYEPGRNIKLSGRYLF